MAFCDLQEVLPLSCGSRLPVLVVFGTTFWRCYICYHRVTLRIQVWLNDPEDVERLVDLKGN